MPVLETDEVEGLEQARSAAAAVWAQDYLRIPIQPPPAGTTPGTCPTPKEAYTYSANDGSVGDLDGDGEYEMVLKWDPSNSKDNSQSGCTGNVYLDAYKLNGKRLWRIDLGRNIRAGAHYTQFLVYDFDGDGKAELAVKTAPGTRDGTGVYLHTGPAASDDDAADYRNSRGYVLSGPEYLTVFGGPTGAELATVSFGVPRGTVSSWGDSYGNRVDRFLASAAFVSDAGGGSQSASGRPSILMARGYYTAPPSPPGTGGTGGSPRSGRRTATPAPPTTGRAPTPCPWPTSTAMVRRRSSTGPR